MRRSMAEAAVGDDCYGDDPTVNTLEALVAEILGKEAAVYMPTGTMSNQVAIRSHTEPGDAVLLEQTAHVYLNEGGAPFALSGVHPRFLRGIDGVFSTADVEAALPQRHPFLPKHWAPPTKLLCVENTHNAGGGKVWPFARLVSVCEAGRAAGLHLHLDGARLWNAAAATKISEAHWAAQFDTVSVCFSKGLGAPVGSALAGTAELISRARRFKTQFGGGFRQAGIVAAGALHALRYHRDRLEEDHANAGIFASGLASIPGIQVDPESIETNMVRFRVTSSDASEFAVRLHAAGVHVLPITRDMLRAVMCLNVTREHVIEAVEITRSVLRSNSTLRPAPGH